MHKKIIAGIFLFFIVCSLHAQLNPWWIQNAHSDSSDIKREATADSIIKFAKTFMHTPYVWGGSDPETGFDCSGFICYVYHNFGIELPRVSAQQFDAGYPVPFDEAQPGDLILFTGVDTKDFIPGHVGIILSYDEINGFTFIHTASVETGGVRISASNDETYFYKRFLEIRRVIIPHQ